MKNCTITKDGNDLVIRIAADQRHGDSKSGKSETVGSTDGIVDLAEYGFTGLSAGVNVFAPKAKPAK